jgi:DNA-binding XRE family transcriptional regulator
MDPCVLEDIRQMLGAAGYAARRDETIRNSSQGWVPVPVCRIADYSGSRCERTVRSFLTVDQIGQMPALNASADDEIWAWLGANFTVCLDNDWRFDQIEADANCRVGHDYAGDKHDSIGAFVIKAVYDIEDALLWFHPNASSAAVGAFWSSWEVRRHISEFCDRLAESPTARLFASKGDVAENVEFAKWYVYRRLARFARELARDSGAEPSAAAGSGNRGGRPQGKAVNGEKLRKLRELTGLTQEELAEKCAISVDTIQRGEAGERWDGTTFENVASTLSILTNRKTSKEVLQNRKN